MRTFFWLPLVFGLVLTGCARLPSPEGWSGGVVVEDVTHRGDVYQRVLYVGTQEGDLRALVAEDQTGPNASGGEELWRYTLRGDVESDLVIYGTPAVAKDTIFFASYNGFLYSLSLDGEELWDTRIGDGEHVVAGVTVADDLVLVGSNDGNVYAYEYDFENHAAALRWVFDTGGEVWSTPAVHDGVAYFGSLDHNVYAVDVASGAEIWKLRTGGGVVAGPVVAAGKVLVGSFDSIFYAIDASTGRTAWKFEGADRWYWGRAVVKDDTVYAPSLDGNLYAIGLEDGLRRWTLETEGAIIGGPAVIGDRLAVPSKDGGVYLVDADDGAQEDQCDLDDHLRASLTVDGDAIFLSDSGRAVRELLVKPNGKFDEGWSHKTNAGQDEPESGNWNCG